MNVNNRTLLIAGAVVVVGSAFILYQWSQSKGNEQKVGIGNKTNDSANDDEKRANALSILDESNGSGNIAAVNRFPVQVFVRIRPLIKEEIENKDEEMSWAQRKTKLSDLQTIVLKNALAEKKRGNTKKSFDGFSHILTPKDDNEATFNKAILPNMNSFFNGNVVCSFAYGHTGSGKTHTMLGYPNANIPGMYELTARYIFKQLDAINKTIDHEIYLEIRFAELYQGKMRDLFSSELVECHVREDKNNNIHIRGPTIKDDKTGQVKVQPLTPFHGKKSDDIINYVNKAKESRNVGYSTKHDESSRSHAFLQFELVTDEIVKARTELLNAEAELVPYGKARDDEMIFIQGNMYRKNEETGSFEENKEWKNPDPNKIVELEKQVKIYEAKVEKADENVENVINKMKSINKCIGGTIVFVDLAGNEWGQDSKSRVGNRKDTPQQARERKEINKSLLSLKECIRSLHNSNKHVPYRNSKLTMVLRPHLKGENSTAIMIANVSSSQNDIAKTVNTLQYSQLVAQA